MLGSGLKTEYESTLEIKRIFDISSWEAVRLLYLRWFFLSHLIVLSLVVLLGMGAIIPTLQCHIPVWNGWFIHLPCCIHLDWLGMGYICWILLLITILKRLPFHLIALVMKKLGDSIIGIVVFGFFHTCLLIALHTFEMKRTSEVFSFIDIMILWFSWLVYIFYGWLVILSIVFLGLAGWKGKNMILLCTVPVWNDWFLHTAFLMHSLIGLGFCLVYSAIDFRYFKRLSFHLLSLATQGCVCFCVAWYSFGLGRYTTSILTALHCYVNIYAFGLLPCITLLLLDWMALLIVESCNHVYWFASIIVLIGWVYQLLLCIIIAVVLLLNRYSFCNWFLEYISSPEHISRQFLVQSLDEIMDLFVSLQSHFVLIKRVGKESRFWSMINQHLDSCIGLSYWAAVFWNSTNRQKKMGPFFLNWTIRDCKWTRLRTKVAGLLSIHAWWSDGPNKMAVKFVNWAPARIHNITRSASHLGLRDLVYFWAILYKYLAVLPRSPSGISYGHFGFMGFKQIGVVYDRLLLLDLSGSHKPP